MLKKAFKEKIRLIHGYINNLYDGLPTLLNDKKSCFYCFYHLMSLLTKMNDKIIFLVNLGIILIKFYKLV